MRIKSLTAARITLNDVIKIGKKERLFRVLSKSITEKGIYLYGRYHDTQRTRSLLVRIDKTFLTQRYK